MEILKTIKCVRDLKIKFEEMKNCNQMVWDMTKLHNQYSAHAFAKFEKKSNDALNVLGQQEYAQEMMEGLINDMLDQAKIDNDAFTLNEEYFDLPMVVFKALNIVKG